MTVTAIEGMLLAALRPGARVIVDGSQVAYMSAAGVRTFASVLHQAANMGARIVSAGSPAPPGIAFVSGFSELLEIAGTVEQAAARLEAEPRLAAGESLHPRGTAG